MKIDFTKCLGCRKGINTFRKDGDKLMHFDMFATAEAAHVYECMNSGDLIGLVETNDNGMSFLTGDYKKIFEEQDYWWTDILDLAYELMPDSNDVQGFFNGEAQDGMLMHQMPNEHIEKALVDLAASKGVEITKDDYPDLLCFK